MGTDHPNHPLRPTQCGKSAPEGRKFPISLPTTQITLSDQHSVANQHPKAENSPSPYRPPKSPYPTNTVWQISTRRQKIPHLPTDHPNPPIRPTQCGKSAPEGRKFPISLPTHLPTYLPTTTPLPPYLYYSTTTPIPTYLYYSTTT